jgi:Spy/CpxP family protein refolding chaperone
MKQLLLIGALISVNAAAPAAPPSETDVAQSLSRPAGSSQPQGPDEVAQNLFPPELIIEHRQDIGLDEAQSKALKDAVQQAQARFLDLQWDMQTETGKLAHLLQAPRIDEAAALAQADKVLGMETTVKKAQLSLLIRIKNLLTPEQQQKLTELRGGRS